MTTIHSGTLPGFAGTPSEEVFAIGDVHGMADLLDAVLAGIADTPPQGLPRRVVFLGDLIDRGPESLRSLELAMSAAARLGCAVTHLMGNHEQMLAIGLCESVDLGQRVRALDLWKDNGGHVVVDELARRGHRVSVREPNGFTQALGRETVEFLLGLKGHYVPPSGDMLFVHAGVSPYEELDAFLSGDWRALMMRGFDESRSWSWIRDPFLEHSPARAGEHGHHGRFVVHGHTPYDCLRLPFDQMVGRHRINLDGYAFSRGKLRYGRFLADAYEVHEVQA